MSVEDQIVETVDQAVERKLQSVIDAQDRPVVCTVEEAARLLCVSRTQIASWLELGHLSRMPDTRRVLIPRVSIERFAERSASPVRAVGERAS